MGEPRTVAAAFLLLFATQILAQRGRPVSDLRFDGQAEVRYFTRVASDGTDFLALTGTRSIAIERTFAQKIVDGRAVGPQREIGRGEPLALAWTGTEYLAAWHNVDGLFVTRISREGTPLAISPTPVVTGDRHRYAFAVNATSAMAFAWTEGSLRMQPLDLLGRPSGPLQVYSPVVYIGVAGPAANGFVLVSPGDGSTNVTLFGPDGVLSRAGTALGASGSAAVATNGSDTAVVVGARTADGRGELRSVILAADGTVKNGERVIATSDHRIYVSEMTWDGSQYVIAAMVDSDPSGTSDDDAALLRMTSSGEASGGLAIVHQPGWQRSRAIASNGRHFLVGILQGALAVDAVTMQQLPPVALGRTLTDQRELVVEPGQNGYLAAWFDTAADGVTVRASRIDAAGNYLDGDGIVLGTIRRYLSFATTIAIDGRGPGWFVVWSDGDGNVQGRSVSRGGIAGGAGPVTIGPGHGADIQWDGSQYIVLRANSSLYRDLVGPDGTVLDTAMLVREADVAIPNGHRYVEQYGPALTIVAGKPMAIFLTVTTDCYIGVISCSTKAEVMGLRLDRDGATPFLISGNGWEVPEAVTDGNRALVIWPTLEDGVMATFIDWPDGAGTPFRLALPDEAAVAFDGTSFIGAWSLDVWQGGQRSSHVSTARIPAPGTVTDLKVTRFDTDEKKGLSLAASATMPALLGFTHQLSAYDDVSRGTLLFVSEIDDAPAAPPAPSITCATSNPDGTITVRWQPLPDIRGVSIELQLPDSTFRQIGVAAAGATSARVSPAGLNGSAVRVRVWNAGGLSEPSPIAPGGRAPQVTMREATRGCAGAPVTLQFTLSGIAPFTVRWSDGLVQSNLQSNASRTATLSRDTTLRIVSVSDAGCAVNETPQSVRVLVDPKPAITEQPREISIPRGQRATISVKATAGATFEWFQGYPGQTLERVGTERTFITPPLYSKTVYWVRVSNRCGSVDSAGIVITPTGKTRAVRSSRR